MSAFTAAKNLSVSRTGLARASRQSVTVKAAAGNWFPGSTAPQHLQSANIAGNYGFDPLGLAKEPDALKWYQQAELQNGRWAMLGSAGILGAELTGHDWVEVQAGQYWAPTRTLFAIQIFLFAFVEFRRLQDYKKPGSANGDPFFTSNKLPDGNSPGYPGGIFDPMGYSKGPDFETLKLKEIKNARLAMLGFLGFVAQHASTGKGPLTNLADHLADPFAINALSNPNAAPWSIMVPTVVNGVPSF